MGSIVGTNLELVGEKRISSGDPAPTALSAVKLSRMAGRLIGISALVEINLALPLLYGALPFARAEPKVFRQFRTQELRNPARFSNVVIR
jgi:hypothetical protein